VAKVSIGDGNLMGTAQNGWSGPSKISPNYANCTVQTKGISQRNKLLSPTIVCILCGGKRVGLGISWLGLDSQTNDEDGISIENY